MCGLPKEISGASKAGAGLSLGGLGWSVLTGDAMTGAAVASLGGLLQTGGAGKDLYNLNKSENEKADAQVKAALDSYPTAPKLGDDEIARVAQMSRRRLVTGYDSFFRSGVDGTPRV